MRVVHCADVVPGHRPDGRVVLPLLDLPVNVPVNQTAILFVEHPANFTEGKHHHQSLHEIFYFLDAADYWVNGTLLHLQPGDLLVLEPNDVHGAVPVPHKVRLIVFHVPKVPGDKVDAPAGKLAAT
ncbi:hypothetical protein F0U62_41720 [Cystobacter fuscus]|jgi:quercetin dioxygenase-like cupin family protein|uniref:hypothetical protein n=1 Tax=Cystobacter fuscus TaxID=43 RepID=UPI002B2997E3|nr:hypothetical protein F0U62_41720 [Cystobacter fuscus]